MPTLEFRVELLEKQMNGLLDVLKDITKVIEQLNDGLQETNEEIAKIREVIKKE